MPSKAHCDVCHLYRVYAPSYERVSQSNILLRADKEVSKNRVLYAFRLLAEIHTKLVFKKWKQLEVISNPVWLGWSINIEFMIGATRMFIMIREKEGVRFNLPKARCCVRKQRIEREVL